jgi:hypothetical protein
LWHYANYFYTGGIFSYNEGFYFYFMVAIGKIIEKVLREKRIPVNEFAKKINTNRNNVYHIFRRETIDTGLLVKIGEILEHDFFQYYISKQTISNIATEKANVYLVNSELKKLQEKNESLSKETNELRSRLHDKEMIIELLKSKS